jgi:GH15 family glucan-1,4-alpha-glucosidase
VTTVPGPDGYCPIGAYAIIGDCRSAALVSSAGSIDWLCWPRFDSPSVFAALLDRRLGGRFSIAPTLPSRTTRRYVGESAVLETTFHTPGGVLRLLDLMPVVDEHDKEAELWPDHELVRQVECVEGEVEVEVIFDPRPDYGRWIPRLRRHGPFGLLCERRGEVIALQSEITLEPREGEGAHARVTLGRGERRTLALTYERRLPAVLSARGAGVAALIDESVRWWDTWMAGCRYDGPYAEAVRRSALTLKLLTYAPSGAVIAAPTTSLPERVGGVRNWDYRYCWLRDASLTLRALFDLGKAIEGEAFLAWMLQATSLTWPNLQILYDVFGEARLPERTVDHLEGYRQSAPVRVGNAAAGQLQLDIYGEVLDAAWDYVGRGGRLDRTTARMLVGLGDCVVRRWGEPDEGIWEPRGGRRHHTHSKALCWVALDRLIRLCESGEVEASIRRFAPARDAIRSAIEAHGFNDAIGSYVSTFDGDRVDASLLLLALMGYSDPGSPRMRGTASKIRERLGSGGLLYRYRGGEDGLPEGEAAFGICSFWGIQWRAMIGEIHDARAEFEHVLSFANDVGLFGEEIDPDTGEALGNFPQAFTHVGLINAALAIARHTGEAPAKVPVARFEGAPDMRGRV